MTREEFDRLVHKIQDEFADRAGALRLRVALLALLGYGLLLCGLAIVLLLAAAFLSGLFWADLQGKIVCGFAGVAVLVAGGWTTLSALLVKVPPPEGVPVRPVDAPALFEMLDDLRRQLRCVPFHHVRLICEHNAAVVQVPRLGVLGWCTNYLLIGVPLLEGHPTAEVRAILAHEFAHLSKRDGRFSHWIYRLRRSWEILFSHNSGQQAFSEAPLRPLLQKCVELFWPRFNAHAFVVSRANEYQADAISARVAGKEHMANSLVRGALQDHLLDDEFWPEVWRGANEAAAPPEGVFRRLGEALGRELPLDKRNKWLEEAMRIPTTNADTHPCLKDRLEALGVGLEETTGSDNTSRGGRGESGDIRRRPNAGAIGHDSLEAFGVRSIPALSAADSCPSAARELLGDNLGRLRFEVEGLWRTRAEKTWKERHARSGALSHRLASIEKAVPGAGADVDALWDKASVLLDLKGDHEVEPLLRQILSQRPGHVAANFHLGRMLLDKGLSEGEAHVERVVAQEQELLPQACSLLLNHYRRAGRPDRLREIELRLDRYEEDLAASRAERSEVTVRDTFTPHELGEEELENLRQVLLAEPSLDTAWLAMKKLRYFPNEKLFLLCVKRKRS